jgi:predicted nucleic acid-binding protein
VTDAYVLDAWALLALIQGEEPAATRVAELLSLGEQEKAVLLLSVINLGEVYYQIGRRRGRQQAERTLELIRALSISFVPASDEAVLQAAAIKMQHAISYADAFAASLAISQDASLVSGDPGFGQLSGIIRLEKLRRSN